MARLRAVSFRQKIRGEEVKISRRANVTVRASRASVHVPVAFVVSVPARAERNIGPRGKWGESKKHAREIGQKAKTPSRGPVFPSARTGTLATQAETTKATPRTALSKKRNLCFTYQSRDTLKSFSFVITFKAIAKLNQEYSNHFS